MIPVKAKLYISIIIAIAALLVLAYYVRPPGVAPPSPEAKRSYVLNVATEGDLPGITWVDDIHPIFTRNVCIRCHTRGKEAIAEGFKEFALGLVDPNDRNNAYWSYHELVYAEGPPQVQRGEINRDGQCCWPREFPETQQRRIWIGHPERSAIMRKLEHDYYDWRKPPRFFEEALSLSWGLPMPMYPKREEDDMGNSGDAEQDNNGNDNEPKEAHSTYYEIRPFYERILLHIRLWAGGGKDELRKWPSRISSRDRALLRYWINNSMQLNIEGTGITVEVRNDSGSPVKGAVVELVGNYNSFQRKAVADQLAVVTDSTGKAALSFPKHSVVSSVWYIAAKKNKLTSEFKSIELKEGDTTQVSVKLPPQL